MPSSALRPPPIPTLFPYTTLFRSNVRHFVLIKGDSSDPRVTTLATLLERGAGVEAAAFEALARTPQPDDLATFVYTSGTTGQPKGVDRKSTRLNSSHRCISYAVFCFTSTSYSYTLSLHDALPI